MATFIPPLVNDSFATLPRYPKHARDTGLLLRRGWLEDSIIVLCGWLMMAALIWMVKAGGLLWLLLLVLPGGPMLLGMLGAVFVVILPFLYQYSLDHAR